MEQLLKRAINGDSAAQVDLGLRLLSGCCTARDWPNGIRWLIRAAEAGEPEAQKMLQELESVAERHLYARCCPPEAEGA